MKSLKQQRQWFNMPAVIQLEILKPDKKIYNGLIESITVPGTLGSFQVLKNHAPLLSTFEIGEIKIRVGDDVLSFATSGGTVEVLHNKVLVLADSIEQADKIDVDRAAEAKKRAEERLAEKKSNIDIARAEAALKRALNRLKLAERFIHSD
jgi:F-type H+-transporting ATPase subunit epsilon